MTSMRDVVAFAQKIDHAEVHVLNVTHPVPLEFPDEISGHARRITLVRSDLSVPADLEERVADEADAPGEIDLIDRPARRGPPGPG